MTEFSDDFDETDETSVRDQLTRKLRTEGALKAYDTAISICDDAKATAAAKASAVNSLFRAAGFFANHDLNDGEKDLSQMSPAEVDAALRKATAALKKRPDERKPLAPVVPKGSLFD
jgi:hypothetical protein